MGAKCEEAVTKARTRLFAPSYSAELSWSGGEHQSLRGRLPFIVFLLLLVIAVVMIGFACACIADHPAKALDRATSAIPTDMPVVDMWPLIVLLLAPAWLFVPTPRRALGRASPPLLQRFLF